jgi:SAM-dependent methyltransferase
MFFLASAPFRDEEVADYERRRYRGLDQRMVHRRELRILRKILDRLESSAPPAAPSYALDAPCGYGRFSNLLLERNFLLVSSDLSPAMVRRARTKDTISIKPIGIVSNITRGLPFRAGAFRLILSMRFFHHLHRSEERRRALTEFAAATGDWVVLSYYQANALHLFQRRLRRLTGKSRTRIKMISRGEFRDEVTDSGFEIVRIFSLFRGLHSQHIVLLKKRSTQ